MEVERNPSPLEAQLRMELGRRIVGQRERRGWSRSELALRLGVSANRLWKWESGLHAPGLAHLLALGLLFEISLDELITGNLSPAALSEPDRGRLETAAGLASRLTTLLAPFSFSEPVRSFPPGGNAQETP